MIVITIGDYFDLYCTIMSSALCMVFSWKDTYIVANASCTMSLPRAHAQGVKQSVCMSVVVVGTKIARSRVLGICACCKHNQSVDIGEKLVHMRFELLKKAY